MLRFWYEKSHHKGLRRWLSCKSACHAIMRTQPWLLNTHVEAWWCFVLTCNSNIMRKSAEIGRIPTIMDQPGESMSFRLSERLSQILNERNRGRYHTCIHVHPLVHKHTSTLTSTHVNTNHIPQNGHVLKTLSPTCGVNHWEIIRQEGLDIITRYNQWWIHNLMALLRIIFEEIFEDQQKCWGNRSTRPCSWWKYTVSGLFLSALSGWHEVICTFTRIYCLVILPYLKSKALKSASLGLKSWSKINLFL